MNELLINKTLRGANGPIEMALHVKLKKGSLNVLFGKSGAGKSTILKMIAGLFAPDSGRIVIDGERWFDSQEKINFPPQKRKVGFVFQDYALFPNMSVRENLRYGLEKSAPVSKVNEVLEVMELEALANQKPSTLSGGQQQRVALARALVREPKILLLDEPLSALDFAMRAKLQDELLRIQRHFGLTTLLVSHDIGEVYKLAQEVVELENGKVVSQGTPAEIFGGANISGKFKFSGEVVAIEPSDIVFVVSVLIGQDIIKVISNKKEVQALHVGARVTLSSKAFNPLIHPA